MILSIDVGIKNLAFCLLEDHSLRIWKIANISYHKDICSSIIKLFDEIATKIEGSTVVIERQMTKKMCNIQCYLEMYFRMKGHKQVIVYSPKYKLAGSGQENSGKGKNLYRARKKAAIQLCKEWLDTHPQEEWVTKLFQGSKKQDDLSDCLMMAIAYIQNPIADTSDKVPIIRSRKPTQLQQSRGKYSKCNIKYLLEQYPVQKTLEGNRALPIINKTLEKNILRFWPSLEECMSELQLL